MPRPKATYPTDRELDLLQVLWRVKGASLSEIREALRPIGELAASTVATTLRIMADKRLVRRTPDRRWEAVVTQDQTGRRLTERLMNRVFEGSAHQLVAHVVESHPLSKQEIDELQELLEQHRTSRTNDRSRRT